MWMEVAVGTGTGIYVIEGTLAEQSSAKQLARL